MAKMLICAYCKKEIDDPYGHYSYFVKGRICTECNNTTEHKKRMSTDKWELEDE